MVSIPALWLPILLSAVAVFIVSSIMHMVLPYHRSDYKQLPDESNVLAALRAAGVQRGLYTFPHCTHKNMKTPEVVEKFKQGPVGMLTMMPSGPPVMGKFSVTGVRCRWHAGGHERASDQPGPGRPRRVPGRAAAHPAAPVRSGA